MKRISKADRKTTSEVLSYFRRFASVRGMLPRVTLDFHKVNGQTIVHDCDAPNGLTVYFESEQAARAAIRAGEMDRETLDHVAKGATPGCR
jgi:hypothetical protein